MYYDTDTSELLFCTNDETSGYEWVTNTDNSITGDMLNAAVAGEGLVQDNDGNLDINTDDGSTATLEIDAVLDEIRVIEGGIGDREIEDYSIDFAQIQSRQGTDTLIPEYPNFTLYAGTSGNNIGTLEADFDNTNETGYYRWSSNKGQGAEVAQDYTIVVQWAVPENFQAFCDSTVDSVAYACTGSEIEIDYRTFAVGASADELNKIDITLLDTAGSTVAIDAAATLVGTTSDVWVEDYGLDFTTAGGGTWTPGELVTLQIQMTSKASWTGTTLDNTNPVDIGAIHFNYVAK